MTKLKVAAVHASPVFLDREATVEKICALIDEGGRQDVRLMVFPEVYLPGMPYWINMYAPMAQLPMNVRYAAESVEVPGPEIKRVQLAARRAQTYVVLGISEREGGSLYNTQVYIDDQGRILGKHRKLQPTFAERFIWAQGDGSTLHVWDTPIGKLGGLICWEHTMNLARQALILKGIQIHAASWPAYSTVAGWTEVFDPQVDAMCRAHAVCGQCFVIVAQNPVTQEMLDLITSELGPQELMTTGGGWSGVIRPMGVMAAGPHVGLEEKLVVADIDLGEIAFLKSMLDSAGHYARPEVLRLVVDAEPKSPLEERGTIPMQEPIVLAEED
ncbi:MAG: carbon-nitrogen hydrolase family protein [Myxococcales bacterium]|nr:carbon-nitrogen hydrolase family protein [Myxococcales bacterium]